MHKHRLYMCSSGKSFELNGNHIHKIQYVACMGDYRLFEAKRVYNSRAVLSKAVGKATCVNVDNASQSPYSAGKYIV